MWYDSRMTTITPEQRQAVLDTTAEAVELADPATGAMFYLLSAETYHKMLEKLENVRDAREREEWSGLASRARNHWAVENPL